LFEQAAERGAVLSTLAAHLHRLLDTYGQSALTRAVDEALAQQTPHLGAIRQILNYHREQRGQPPLLAAHLTDDARVRELCVREHDLNTYDQLMENTDDRDLQS
jgi:hypothetical protein